MPVRPVARPTRFRRDASRRAHRFLAAFALAGALGASTATAQPVPEETRAEKPKADAGPPNIVRVLPEPSFGVVSEAGLGRFQVQFDEAVFVRPGRLAIWTVTGGAVPGFASVSEEGGRLVTIDIPSGVRNDRVTILLGDTIVDRDGNPLDGEIGDPRRPAFPSGDGDAGGQAAIRFDVLQGDATRNGVVDAADEALVRSALGTRRSDLAFVFDADLDGDEDVDVIDLQICLDGLGASLPLMDGVPPEIVSRTPMNGASVSAPVLDTVTVVFSEPMRADSFDPGSLLVFTPDGGVVSATSAVLDPSQMEVAFTFDPPFSTDGTYRFALANGFADASGEFVDGSALRWSVDFTSTLTRRARSSPSPGETGVALTRETIVEFDRPIERTSVDASSVYAEFGGSRLAARLHVSADATRVTLFYANPLPQTARVRVTLDGDRLMGASGIPVDADGDNVPGGIGIVDFDTLGITTLPDTSVCGRVFASEMATNGGPSVNVPLEGATISVDGAEATLFTTTDAMGNFRLEPAPAGRFFVHIDGSTAVNPVPEGAYYPKVGKAWQSVPGIEINVGDAFLPLIIPGTLQPVSTTTDTQIVIPQELVDRYPKLGGVSVTVPAGSLFHDDGTPGTMVGIGPVPPDRIPGRLPDTLEFPVVITVQTDGAANFDIPVPVVFPNVRNRRTNEILPPGAESALWSFNHDTGAWEVVGPMTVTEDGRYVVSDPGVGIRAPGWHGTFPGLILESPPPPPPCSDPPGGGDLWALAKAVKKCLKDMGSIDRIIKKGIAVVDAVRKMQKNIGTIRKALDDGGISASEAKALLDLLLPLKAVAKATWDCFTMNSPAGKAADAVQCLTGLLNTASGILCGHPGCYPRVFEDMCPLLTNLATLIDSIASKIDKLEMLVSDAPLAAGCLAFDGLRNVLCQFGGATGDGGEGELDAAFDAADEALGSAAARIGDPDLAEVFDPARRELQRLSDLLDLYIVEKYGLASGRYRLRITGVIPCRGNPQSPGSDLVPASCKPTQVDSSEFGVLDELGTFEFTVPPIVGGYRLDVFIPAENALATAQDSVPLGDPDGRFSPTSFHIQFLDDELDSDGDGLADIAESIVLTGIHDPDTDDDGVSDFAELLQGSEPRGGLPSRTGIIATADTPGTAVDIAAFNDIAVVADSGSGVSVFNVFNGLDPTIVAQVPTPSPVTAMAFEGRYVAAVMPAAGLAIIDIADPPAARIARQIGLSSLAGSPLSVVTAAGISYVGTARGHIVAVDLSTGAVLDRVDLGASVNDVAIEGETLYALAGESVFTLHRPDEGLAITGAAASPGSPGGAFRQRLFVGGGIAYAGHRVGYNTIDVSDPESPSLIAAGTSGQLGWKQMIPNGSGLGIAPVGPNLGSSDPENDVYLFDVSDPGRTDLFLTSFVTPGVATAVSLYNGLAYVSDGDSGLQVVNYRVDDALGVAPSVTLSTNVEGSEVVEGSLLLVTASVSDDVQVRNVELLESGDVVATDGNFPFQFFVRTPRAAQGSEVRIRLRASDTGGNRALSAERVFTIVADATPPRVVAAAPSEGEMFPQGLFRVKAFDVRLSESLDTFTLDGAAVRVDWAGPDGTFGSMDDVPLTATTSVLDRGRRIVVGAIEDPPAGLVRLTLSGAMIANRSGNLLDGDGDGFAGGDFVRHIVLTESRIRFWDVDADGLWSEAVKWSGDTLPQPEEDVVIGVPGLRTVTHDSGATVVRSLACAEDFVLGSSTLSPSVFAEFGGRLTLVGGTLDGPGDVFVSGPLDFRNSSLSGTGRTVAAGGMTMGRSNLSGRTIDNLGTCVVTDIGASATGGAVFNNLAGATFDIRASDNWGYGSEAAMNSFVNAGTIRKSTGAGFFHLDSAIENSGAVEVLRGDLHLGRGHTGSTSGSCTIDAGAKLFFSGTHTVLPSATFAGSGSFGVSAGSVRFETGAVGDGSLGLELQFGAAAVLTEETRFASLYLNPSSTATFDADAQILGNATMSGGSLGGSGDVEIGGHFDFLSSSLSGSGRTVAAGGMTMGRSNLSGRTIDNLGTCVVTDIGASATGWAVFNNLAGATFDIRASDNWGYGSEAAMNSFVNAGTIRKSTGAGFFTLDSAIENSGAVEVRMGDLHLGRGHTGSTSGSCTIDAGAKLFFAGTHTVLPSATFAGSGTFGVSAGSARFETGAVGGGSLGLELQGGTAAVFTEETRFASFLIGGGMATFDANTDIVGNATMSGGSLGGSGDVEIGGHFDFLSASLSGSGRTVAAGGMTMGRSNLSGRTIDNLGTCVVTDIGASATGGAVFNNLAGATFDIRASDNWGYGSGTATNSFDNAGTLKKSTGSGFFEIRSAFANSGTVESLSGTLIFTSFTQTAGATRLDGGSLGGGPYAFQGGILTGAGEVAGPVDNSGADVRPGLDGAGTLTVASTYTQGSGATLSIELGGLAAGTEHDVLAVTGAATLSGTLSVSLVGGYSPNVGDSFAVMAFGSRSGDFTTYSGLSIGGGKRLEPSFGSNGLTLTVVAEP